jgi:CheY-like chemotaxis protein
VILVVEDEPDVRAMVAASLGAEGFAVVEASSGAEGLEIIRSNPEIAVLFTDIVMPGTIDGFGLAHEAKKLRPNLGVVYTSGYIKDLPWGEYGIGHGRMLPKPFRRADLVQAIKQALPG